MLSRGGIRLLLALVAASLLLAACSSGSPVERHVAGAGWVASAPHARPGAPRPTAPNVVFVLTDDLSWNLVRYMPHVLAMEKAGMTFRRYFVTDSLCCPSRTSILTGQFPHNDKVFSNVGRDGGFRAFLANSDENKTFATVLHRQHYLTGFFGKYLNMYQPTGRYFGQRPYVPPGWSAWDVADNHGYDQFGYTLTVGRRLGHYADAPDDYLTSVLSQKASQFVATSVRARRPFFAEIATYSPHGPYVPAPADASRFPHVTAPRDRSFGRQGTDPPGWLRMIPPLTKTDIQHFNAVFRRRVQSVQSVDRMIGRLEAELRRLGVADNTYLVFSSDNGLHLGEHDLRQGKSTAFDTDILVPTVVVGPSVPSGVVDDSMTSNVDLAPTFEQLAGARPPAMVDGRSLVPLLRGQDPSSWRRAVLVEHHGPSTARIDPDAQVPYAGDPPKYEAIRTERYLYVEYVDGEREFYDLRSDPAELHNVYARLPARLKHRLHAALARASTCHGQAQCWRAQRDVP